MPSSPYSEAGGRAKRRRNSSTGRWSGASGIGSPGLCTASLALVLIVSPSCALAALIGPAAKARFRRSYALTRMSHRRSRRLPQPLRPFAAPVAAATTTGHEDNKRDWWRWSTRRPAPPIWGLTDGRPSGMRRISLTGDARFR